MISQTMATRDVNADQALAVQVVQNICQFLIRDSRFQALRNTDVLPQTGFCSSGVVPFA